MKNIFLAFLLSVSLFSFSQNTTFTRVINNDSADKSIAAFQTGSGDYFILSNTTSSGQGQIDLQVTKTNGLGNTQWSYTYGSTGDDIGTSMKPTNDGGAIICGYSDSLTGFGDEDMFITKLSSAGVHQWTKYIRSDSVDRANDVMQSKAGDFYLTGHMKMDTMDINTVVARLSSSGTVNWVKTFGGDGDDYGNSIMEDDLGRIIVVGSMANDSTNVGSTGDNDVNIMALTTTGTILKSVNIGTTEDDFGTAMVLASNFEYYIGGNTGSGIGSGNNSFVYKLDSNFSVLSSNWVGVIDDDRLGDLRLLGNGRLLVSSSSLGSSGTNDAYIYEYDPVSGFTNIGFTIGGFDEDAVSEIKIVGREVSGFSLLSSGLSLGVTATEDIYLSKLDEFLESNCGFAQDNINFGMLSVSTGIFANSASYTIYGGSSFSRDTISNNDTLLCCNLEARTIGDSVTICSDESVSIGSPSISGYVYSWTALSGSYSSSSSNPSVSPEVSTTYKLVVSSSDGLCMPDSSLVNVKVNQKLDPVSLPDTFFCVGDSILINATSGMNYYEWNTPDGKIVQPSIFVSVASPNITLFTIDNNSCIYIDTFSVEQKALPTFSLGPDSTICENLNITLMGPSNMFSYEWNGNLSSSNTYTTNVSRVNDLTVVDSFGCEFSDDIQILTKPNSPFSLGPDTLVCPGANFTLFGPSALTSYKWNNVSSTLSSKAINSEGTYWAEAYNSFGCPSYDTVVVSFHADPAFSLGNDTAFCDMINYQLVGPSGLSDYLWSDSSTSQNLTIDTAGIYYLTISDNNECTHTDSINVTLGTSPTISLGTDTIIPSSGLLTLTPGSGYQKYDWSTGATTESVQISDTGVYSVTVTNSDGCSGYAEIYVNKTVSITYLDGIRYSVYPNPASNTLHISSSAATVGAKLLIVDVVGKEVCNSVITAPLDEIDVSNLPSGLYKVIILQDNKVLNLSVIISH